MDLNKKTQQKPLGKLFGFLRGNRLKNLEFSFSPEKKHIYTQKIVVKLILAKKMTENGYSH